MWPFTRRQTPDYHAGQTIDRIRDVSPEHLRTLKRLLAGYNVKERKWNEPR